MVLVAASFLACSETSSMASMGILELILEHGILFYRLRRILVIPLLSNSCKYRR
ncbi:MAG: hypothetical protein L7F77_14645 [Candidatus Magnetominusculus sp. LBB02]|nr:hypothetical protein [Candidatus Magnetominusculus sp. LBB02]